MTLAPVNDERPSARPLTRLRHCRLPDASYFDRTPTTCELPLLQVPDRKSWFHWPTTNTFPPWTASPQNVGPHCNVPVSCLLQSRLPSRSYFLRSADSVFPRKL